MSTTFEAPRPVPELRGVTAEIFQGEIYPAARPVVMRGLVDSWTSVSKAKASPGNLRSYLSSLAEGRSAEVLTAPPDVQGRFFYRPDYSGLNFSRHDAPLADVLEELSEGRRAGEHGALYVQSTPTRALVPGFEQADRLDFLKPEIEPRIWIGNDNVVQTHFDLSQNIACVVSGRRRFTLFPPEQTPNLYMGPIERTLAGTPVSLVDLSDVDNDRFPRFEKAAAAAMSAELGPGDAIFIPYFWWHHVQALDTFNVLINYWWNEYDILGSPMDALLHGILAFRDLPPHMKEPWRLLFEQYVFADGTDAAAHIPKEIRGGLGAMDWPARVGLWQSLAKGVSGFAQSLVNRRR